MSKSSSKNILMILTGSIACYKACTVISQLKQKGYTLKVVLSKNSQEFIGRSTIEGLTGEAPITDMYAQGHNMDHINLMRWADLILVAPATANYINKIAHGLGDDLLTTLFLAHDFTKPFMIAPAMNTKMYLHPTTQNSIEILKKMNIEILETASGVLACGEVGSGKLLEPDLLIQEVEKYFQPIAKYLSRPLSSLKVLITAGGTSEPIDDVRVITNRSTGRTAATIADALIKAGVSVTYLHSHTAFKPENSCELLSFDSFQDLQISLTKKLEETSYYAIIHAAAISDYSVLPQIGKIDSARDEILMTLKKNPKLINEIKKISPQSKLFGFKLTSTSDDTIINKKVISLFETGNCDWVIQNNWSDIKNKDYIYKLFDKTMVHQNISGLQNLSSIIFQKLIESSNQAQEIL